MLQVDCEFRDSIAITVVHYDQEDRNSVNGKKENSWVKDFTYDHGVTVPQMKALIDTSSFCYQEIM